jgi:hypothetical protein
VKAFQWCLVVLVGSLASLASAEAAECRIGLSSYINGIGSSYSYVVGVWGDNKAKKCRNHIQTAAQYSCVENVRQQLGSRAIDNYGTSLFSTVAFSGACYSSVYSLAVNGNSNWYFQPNARYCSSSQAGSEYWVQCL